MLYTTWEYSPERYSVERPVEKFQKLNGSTHDGGDSNDVACTASRHVKAGPGRCIRAIAQEVGLSYMKREVVTVKLELD